MALVDVTPVYENTTMQASYNSENVLRTYWIKPIEGYVLHSSGYDFEVYDEATGMPTGEILLGYIRYPGSVTVAYNYDFEANPRNIFAVPEDSVPADQIFGGANNDHEVM